MILPEDKAIALRNSVGLVLVLCVCFSAAALLHMAASVTFLNICVICLTLFLLCVGLIYRLARSTAEQPLFQLWAPRGGVTALLVLALLWIANMSLQSINAGALVTPGKVAGVKIHPSCRHLLSNGHWESKPCVAQLEKGAAVCGSQRWVWAPTEAGCPLGRIPPSKASGLLRNRRVVFLGDSVLRNVYHEFNTVLDPVSYEQSHNTSLKHTDLHYRGPSSNATVSFVWAPQTKDILSYLKSHGGGSRDDLLVIGASLWDALHERGLKEYGERLEAIAEELSVSVTSVWVQPTTVIDEKLTAADKLEHMREAVVQTYRDAVVGSALSRKVHVLLDTRNVSLCQEDTCVDGIHYGKAVYAVIAQQVLNGFALHQPSFYAGPSRKPAVGGKVTGSMSSPLYGFFVVVLSVVMLFGMDAFLGIGRLSLLIFGIDNDWETAYGPLHKKILRVVSTHRLQQQPGNLVGAGEEESSALLGKDADDVVEDGRKVASELVHEHK